MLECGPDWQPVQTHSGTWIYARRVDAATLEAFTCGHYRKGQVRLRDGTVGVRQRFWRDTVRFREDALPADIVCGFLTSEAAERLARGKVPAVFDADVWVTGLLAEHGIQ